MSVATPLLLGANLKLLFFYLGIGKLADFHVGFMQTELLFFGSVIHSVSFLQFCHKLFESEIEWTVLFGSFCFGHNRGSIDVCCYSGC